ncbi:MAG: HK97 gp10 family phage protein [Thermoplasmata archaeon]|nr:HK97 gp10 family phage protein [Thermoplasmata archaeon]
MFKVTVKQKGDWNRTDRFLKNAQKMKVKSLLTGYGQAGVTALASATPKDSSLTASSWDFSINYKRGRYTIEWFNTNVNRGVVIAILIQYGHGTGTGGYVRPTDYINPAMKPIFEKLADELWKEVKRL